MAESVTEWAKPNPINQNKSGIIGKGVERYEGPLKVSGTAPYAFEIEPPSPPHYGYMVGSEIGSGRVVAVVPFAEDAGAVAGTAEGFGDRDFLGVHERTAEVRIDDSGAVVVAAG